MSDATSDYTTIPVLGGTVREVQGRLPDEGTLQQAIQESLLGQSKPEDALKTAADNSGL